jgi:hypothetical protein
MGGVLSIFYLLIMSGIIMKGTIQMLRYDNQTVTKSSEFLDDMKVKMGDTGYIPVFGLIDANIGANIRYNEKT